MQPIRRFNMDAAIIFSDILVVPHALGAEVTFEEKKGPVLKPIQTEADLDRLSLNMSTLAPVYEALRLTKKGLPDETALIGFAGSPWTLACYMVQGQSSKDFQSVRSVAYSNRAFFTRLITLLTDSVIAHVLEQIKADAEVIQLFDSWSGVLSEQEFSEWVIAPTTKIVAAIKAAYPDVPVIGFPRQSGSKCLDYALATKVDGMSLDSSVSLAWAKKQLNGVCVMQGNLDNVALAENKESMIAQTQKILSAWGRESFSKNPFVFNLGHGILPHTPIEHVEILCNLLRHHEHQ